MTGTFGMPLLQRGNEPGGRRNHPLLELRRRQAARPAVEQLHGLGAGFDLARQIFERDFLDPRDDLAERPWIRVGQAPGFGLVAATLARDHVGRDRPRAPSKADAGSWTGASSALTFATVS